MSGAPIVGTPEAARFGQRRFVGRRRCLLGLMGFVYAGCATTPVAPPALAVTRPADVRWRGDAETGDLGQWSYQLNPRGLSVVTVPVAEGARSVRVEIRPTDLWPNGLNRVELEHKPPPETVAEGGEIYFAWSLLVPAELSTSRHQIGYWESYPSYRQIMALEARGRALAFVTRLPEEQVHWTASDALTPNVWHRVVMHIRWSADPAKGVVDVCFDGVPVVLHASARTLWDNPNFVHVGVLRDKPEPTEVMFIDGAIEGTSLHAVLGASPAVPTR